MVRTKSMTVAVLAGSLVMALFDDDHDGRGQHTRRHCERRSPSVSSPSSRDPERR